MNGRALHFNAFIWPNGYHESAWRVVDDDVHNVLKLSYYTDIARTAERGLMDSIFLADNIAIAGCPAAHTCRRHSSTRSRCSQRWPPSPTTSG